MKQKLVVVTAPKSKGAALNQAVYIYNQILNHTKKGERIMKQKRDILSKIEKLNSTLEDLQNQLNQVDSTSITWKAELSKLEQSFQLTQAEITQEHARLIQLRIEDLKASAGVTEKGSSLI